MGTVPIPSDATVDEAAAPPSGAVPIPQDAIIDPDPTQPTPEQVAYRKATQAGPFAPAGAAESAITQQMGGELGVLKQGLKTAAEGAATAVGTLGGMEAVPSVLAHTTEGVKAIGDWASKNPMQAYLLYQVIKEFIPGAKKAIGFIKGAPDVPQPPAP